MKAEKNSRAQKEEIEYLEKQNAGFKEKLAALKTQAQESSKKSEKTGYQNRILEKENESLRANIETLKTQSAEIDTDQISSQLRKMTAHIQTLISSGSLDRKTDISKLKQANIEVMKEKFGMLREISDATQFPMLLEHLGSWIELLVSLSDVSAPFRNKCIG